MLDRWPSSILDLLSAWQPGFLSVRPSVSFPLTCSLIFQDQIPIRPHWRGSFMRPLGGAVCSRVRCWDEGIPWTG